MRRIPRMMASGVRTGTCLFLLFGFAESLVLFAKRPEPWSLGLAARLFWSPAIYGLVGAAAGAVAGLVASCLLQYRSMRITLASERSSVWSLLLPLLIGFYWVYAANRLYPGNSRDTTALALDAVALLAALLLAVLLWRKTVPHGAGGRERAAWTIVLLVLLWLPLYAAVGAPSLERTRVSPRPEGIRDAPAGSLNVLLITVDTVRTDCLGCYGSTELETPAIDLLASEGTLFETAITPEPLTRPAVCTMFTGLHPRAHGVDSNTKPLLAGFETLAEAMRAAGYRTAAFTAASVLSGFYGTAQGFDYYSEPSEPWWYLRSDSAVRRFYLSITSWADWWVEIPAGTVTKQATDWIERNGEWPFFAFVHYYDPHAPYEPPPTHDFAAQAGLGHIPPPYDEDWERFVPGFEMPGEYLRQEWLEYQGEISYVDENLTDLFVFLKRNGLDERTLVVLVGDHGESFEHNAWFSHGTRLYDSQVHVPLILRGPGIPRGVRVPGQVRLTDLHPTILSAVGLSSSEPVQGLDLGPRMAAATRLNEGGRSGDPALRSPEQEGRQGSGPPPGPGDRRFGGPLGDLPAYCQTDLVDRKPWSSRVSFALRLPPWKLILSPELELRELYDLKRDPAETLNLVEERPELAMEMESQLQDWKDATERLEIEQAEMPFEKEQELRALGYVQ